MEEQRIGVPLLEGVCTASEALGLGETVTIGGVECNVLLPVLSPARGRWLRHLAGPVAPDGDHEEDPGWRKSMEGIWGDPRPGSVIIRAVGIILVGTAIPPGDEHIDFDHAVAQWRHLLQDWLAVAAEGPTDSPDRDYYGATVFGSSEYDGEYDGDDVPYRPLQSGHTYLPQPLSAWAWSHAIGHASAGDQPPLARALMTTASRAATTANWRVAIIDAATAVEVALTAGMAARVSGEASSRIANALFDATSMLGRRLDLAKKLDMPLPPKIREDLVERRNAVVHRGEDITGAQARAAIAAAWKVIREYDSLPACCRDPASTLDAGVRRGAGRR